ncbi:MAG: hypothetical protein ACT4PU_07055 [Planctomycetota bacterium]
MIKTLCTALLLTAIATPLTAQIVIEPPFAEPQPIGVTGIVRPYSLNEAADSLAICAPPEFILEAGGTTLYLLGGEIDLAQYVDKLVKISAVQSVLECPFFTVFEIAEPPPATLEICGTGGLGCPVRLRSGPGGLAQHALFVSLGPGFVPLPPLRGSFLLADPFFMVGTAFSLNFSEGAAFDFTVPFEPQLTGLTLHFQAARKEVGLTTGFGSTNPPLQFGNAVNLHIVGLTLWCVEPDC